MDAFIEVLKWLAVGIPGIIGLMVAHWSIEILIHRYRIARKHGTPKTELMHPAKIIVGGLEKLMWLVGLLFLGIAVLLYFVLF